MIQLVKGGFGAGPEGTGGWVGILICRRHKLDALGVTTVLESAEPVEKWVE